MIFPPLAPSSDTAARRQRQDDRNALDRYPACPRCSNLCGLLAVVCADCGARLRPTEFDLRDAQAVGSAAMQAARNGEAESSTREREG